MTDINIYSLVEKANNHNICERQQLDTHLNDKYLSTFECPHIINDRIYDRLHYNDNCVIENSQLDKMYSTSIGYECLDETNDLLLTPDKHNTFKNYQVLHENGEMCSKNHQVYNNWTRRKMPFVNSTPPQKDIIYQKIPELSYNCTLSNYPINVNVPFDCDC